MIESLQVINTCNDSTINTINTFVFRRHSQAVVLDIMKLSFVFLNESMWSISKGITLVAKFPSDIPFEIALLILTLYY